MQETTFNPFALQAFVRNKQVTSLTVLKEYVIIPVQGTEKVISYSLLL
jgi:uncharacterized Zn finger protein